MMMATGVCLHYCQPDDRQIAPDHKLILFVICWKQGAASTHIPPIVTMCL